MNRIAQATRNYSVGKRYHERHPSSETYNPTNEIKFPTIDGADHAAVSVTKGFM